MGGGASDELQRVFKTLSDPTRMRILRLLEREELVVQELMEILGMAQSRVSRHLAVLREVGLLSDRRDGTYVFYRFVPPAEGAWRDGWALVRRELSADPTSERDDALLRRAIEARSAQARNFFDAVGPEWDALRKVFNDDALRARAVSRLIDPGLTGADIGTGTGILAIELARLGVSVIAIDHSARTLDAARAKISAEPGLAIDLRHGEDSDLPLRDAEVDATLAHMVLHYLPPPAEAIREMARGVAAGGSVVVVDFVAHEHEWMREELGVTWLGFELDEVKSWFDACGLQDLQCESHPGLSAGRNLPATFIISGRTPR